MLTEWNAISEPLQLHLATQALHKVAEIIADQADCLAEEMEQGGLADRSGADALRLLASIVRAAQGSSPEEPSRPGRADAAKPTVCQQPSRRATRRVVN